MSEHESASASLDSGKSDGYRLEKGVTPPALPGRVVVRADAHEI